MKEKKEIISEQWRIKLDEKGNIMLGELKRDNTYLWYYPSHYPPILLTLRWKIVLD
ncbi:hypothetical protein D3C80_1903020 [compost metagenome]